MKRSTMNGSQLEALTLLRTVVGYLGEREHHSWWQSSFLNVTSRAFLTPVFARTHILAQYSGVTHAAAIIHDARIGVGSVFHLFRLPEDIEQGLHRTLSDASLAARIEVAVRDQDSALAYLTTRSTPVPTSSLGPTRVGDIHDLRSERFWSVVAGHYAQAFFTNSEIYPYFTDRS